MPSIEGTIERYQEVENVVIKLRRIWIMMNGGYMLVTASFYKRPEYFT